MKELYDLEENYRVAGSMYRERLHEIKKETVEKLLKEGVLSEKVFHLDPNNRKLVYQGSEEIHPLLTEVLSLEQTVMVNRFHWRIATFDNKRFSNLTISMGKAVVHLPEDMTKEEFKEILKVTGITEIDRHNVDWELGRLERMSNLCKIIRDVKYEGQ